MNFAHFFIKRGFTCVIFALCLCIIKELDRSYRCEYSYSEMEFASDSILDQNKRISIVFISSSESLFPADGSLSLPTFSDELIFCVA